MKCSYALAVVGTAVAAQEVARGQVSVLLTQPDVIVYNGMTAALPATLANDGPTTVYINAIAVEVGSSGILGFPGPLFSDGLSLATSTQTAGNLANLEISSLTPTGVYYASVNTYGGPTPDDLQDLGTQFVRITVKCYANCDGSTAAPLLTANDFQCFLNKFAAGNSFANCDGSTLVPVLTANDFQCFLNSYATGCP